MIARPGLNQQDTERRALEFTPAVIARNAILVACTLAAAAQVSVPLSGVTAPFTLQSLVVVLAGPIVGARAGTLGIALYLCLGGLGLPAFADAANGWAVLIGPTAGFLWAFLLIPTPLAHLARRVDGSWSGIWFRQLPGRASDPVVTRLPVARASGGGHLGNCLVGSLSAGRHAQEHARRLRPAFHANTRDAVRVTPAAAHRSRLVSTLNCWNCGAALDGVLLPLSRRADCAACRAELHCCRMCVHFDPDAPDRCKEDRAEPPRMQRSQTSVSGSHREPDSQAPYA